MQTLGSGRLRRGLLGVGELVLHLRDGDAELADQGGLGLYYTNIDIIIYYTILYSSMALIYTYRYTLCVYIYIYMYISYIILV